MTHSLSLGPIASLRNDLFIILGATMEIHGATIVRRFSSFSGVMRNCLKKNSWSNSFSSLTKTWNSPFECLSIKICRTQNLFLLILLFLRLKCKRSNSQSNSFLAKVFAIAFVPSLTACLAKTKSNFSRSSKILSNPRRIFSCLRKIIFPVRGKISEVDSSFYLFYWKGQLINNQHKIISLHVVLTP